MSVPAKAKYIALSLLFILATVNFAKTTLNILKNSRRLDDLRVEVADLEGKKVAMEQELTFRRTSEYIAREARNKLNMILPGEEVYVVANNVPVASKDNSGDVSGAKTEQTAKPVSNFDQWLALFGCGARICTGAFRL